MLPQAYFSLFFMPGEAYFRFGVELVYNLDSTRWCSSLIDLKENTTLPIQVQFLKIWINELQYEDDGDWLNITVSCSTEDSMVRVQGPIVTSGQLIAFSDQITKLSRGLYGTAMLASEEPYLSIQVKAEKSFEATMTVDITPDYFSQKHQFITALNKTDLEKLAEQLNKVKDK